MTGAWGAIDRGQRACWLILVVLVAVGYSGWRAFRAEQRAKLPCSAIFSGHVAVVDAVDAVKLPPGDRLSERALALSAATLEEVMEVADERNALYTERVIALEAILQQLRSPKAAGKSAKVGPKVPVKRTRYEEGMKPVRRRCRPFIDAPPHRSWAGYGQVWYVFRRIALTY